MANKFLIVDSRGNAVARCIPERGGTDTLWRLRIDDGDLDEVMSHTNVSLVSSAQSMPALEGKIIRREGDLVLLEPVRSLGESLRKNLRIPVRFVSYLYPVSGQWRGRVPIVSKDLSCGGLAFFCPRPLEIDETAQVVIPVTSQPLLLTLQVLRLLPTPEEERLYAAQFVNLVREEENMVREAVFSIQLKNS